MGPVRHRRHPGQAGMPPAGPGVPGRAGEADPARLRSAAPPMSWSRIFALSSLAALAFAILAWPSDAHAWGPLAHLSFSAQALQNLGLVQSPVRALLEDFGNEFLYGSLAADQRTGTGREGARGDAGEATGARERRRDTTCLR